MQLIILNDPAGVTGARRVEMRRDLTLQQNIEAVMPSAGGCVLRINGMEADPLADPRLDSPPVEGDLVTVEHRPEGVETWVLVASVLLAAYSYSLVPRNLSQPVQTESTNNRLTGQTNIARAYQAVPDVFGYRRVWPDLMQPSLVEYVDHVKYVTEWLCVSRGKGTASAIQFAETALSEIDGATYALFEPDAGPSAYPELNTTTITDVLEPFACEDVNGQELSASLSVSPISSPIVTLTADGTSTFQLAFNDGPELTNIKALAPSGTVRLAFMYGYTVDVGDGSASGTELYDATATVVSYSVVAGVTTFTFSGPSNIGYVSGGSVFALETSVASFYYGSATTATVGPFTMPRESDRLQWNIVFLRGLKGNVFITTEWWKVDALGAEVPGTRQNNSAATGDTPDSSKYQADTYDERAFTRRVTPTGGLGRYKIQFTRTNADLGNGADVAKLETVYALRHYATKALPGITAMKVVTKATTQATGFRERKFNLRWLRHVRTLTSTTLSPSRNFARAMVHLWCVAGKDIAEWDTTALATINTALGEDSTFLRFDGSLDDADMSIGERLRIIANVARCVVWRDGTKWTVTREQRKTTPELQLDYRNLARGGESSISIASHLPASYDGVEVEYVDETTQASKAYVRLSVASGSVVAGGSPNPLRIKLTGCATLQQADNRAHMEARRLMYQRTSVNDTALADAAALGVGSLVRWVDPNDFAGDDDLQAGEVLAIAGSVVTTSEPLDWKGQASGRMLITGIDGLYIGSPIVVTPTTGGATLASVPAGIFVRDSTRQVGSRYAFAVGLTDAEMQAAGLYTLTSLKPAENRNVSIALVNYDARLFDKDLELPVGLATERDTALRLFGRVSVATGRADETDTAFARPGVQIRAVGMATETDTALAL